MNRVQTGYHAPLREISEDGDIKGQVDFGQETEFRDDQQVYRKTGFQKGKQKMDIYDDEVAKENREVAYELRDSEFNENTKVQRIQTGF